MFKLIFEKSKKDRVCQQIEQSDVPYNFDLPYELLRQKDASLPEIAQIDLVRHYTNLSRRTYGVDTGFYPLGSCTMKYNPKLNEDVAQLHGFSAMHPLQNENTVQGCLEVMYNLAEDLCEICGMDAFTLQGAAGAQGEWAGLQLIRAYHENRKDYNRLTVLVPDAAHGTNPASAAMTGYNVVNVPSDAKGMVDVEALKSLANETTAALMLTNPNTLGIFDTNIKEIADIVHNAGGLLYYDGANLNAIMGISRPGDMGFDVVHLNLHKTFSTPHGGGGPGSGPVGCKAILKEFLPQPSVKLFEGKYSFDCTSKNSIGKIKAFYGNFLVYLKAYTYIKCLGKEDLKQASLNAVLNANYMLDALKEYSDLKYTSPCMHEFVLSLESLKKQYDVSALDVAKALIEYGIHPPTMYFPLIVHEALMLEPTETESKETLDMAIDALKQIFETAKTQGEKLHEMPISTPVRRLDEVLAARKPIVRYEDISN